MEVMCFAKPPLMFGPGWVIAPKSICGYDYLSMPQYIRYCQDEQKKPIAIQTGTIITRFVQIVLLDYSVNLLNMRLYNTTHYNTVNFLQNTIDIALFAHLWARIIRCLLRIQELQHL